MKLDQVQQDQVTFSGGEQSSSFSIAMNGKAFKVLSSTLYQNKIGSIVREISCNAYDSHIMNGTPDLPFTLHLPDSFEPWFSVQDYGVGLSPAEIDSVFKVYFSSTKDNSNDAIGAFGLGSKTPFSYTDQFSISAVKDNQLSVYSAYITSSGIPDIRLMHSEETTAPTGVEIKMSVKREDYITFSNEVLDQLQYFKVKPLLLNTSVKFKINNLDQILFETANVKIRNSMHTSPLTIVQGNVGYPLNIQNLELSNEPELKKLVELLHKQKSSLFFDIGEINITASREGVEYNAHTLDSVKKKLQSIQTEIHNHIDINVKKQPTDWDKAFFINSNEVLSSVCSSPKLPNTIIQYGQHVFSLKSIIEEKIPSGYTKAIGRIYSMYSNKLNQSTPMFSPSSSLGEDKLLLVLKDKTSCHMQKLKYLHKANPKYMIKVLELDSGIYDDISISTIKNLLGGMDNIIKLSSVVIPKVAKVAIVSVRTKTHNYFEYKGYEWLKLDKLDFTKKTVYVEFTRCVGNKLSFDAVAQCEMLNAINLSEHVSDDINLVAIRSTELTSKLNNDSVFKTNFVNVKSYSEDAKSKIFNDKALIDINQYKMLKTILSPVNRKTLDKLDVLVKIAPKNKAIRLLSKLQSQFKKFDMVTMNKISNLYNSMNIRSKSSTYISSVYNNRAGKIQIFKDKLWDEYPILKVSDSYSFCDKFPAVELALCLRAKDEYNALPTDMK